MTKEETRPRYRLYPYHADYSPMVMEFRPYAMYINEPNYRSEAVNTDEMGFRHQYLNSPERMRWAKLKDEFQACDALVGNSTVFGVDAPSDRATISHHMNTMFKDPAGTPVINLGIRGATSQQELVTFQSMRRFMPPVRRIIIFSGIITATVIALPNSFIYRDFGTIFSEVYNFGLFCQQYKKAQYDDRELALHRFHEWIDRQLRTFPRLERLIMRKFAPAPKRVSPVLESPSQQQDRYEAVMALFAGDMRNWAAIAKGMGAEVDFVLQPTINWTVKPMTPEESVLFEIDFKDERFHLKEYATKEFYHRYRERVSRICEETGVAFHDANEWLNSGLYDDMTIFSDVCHMTDIAAQVMAQLLRERLYKSP